MVLFNWILHRGGGWREGVGLHRQNHIGPFTKDQAQLYYGDVRNRMFLRKTNQNLPFIRGKVPV